MTFKPATPILRIFDVAKAREFYVEFLGFSVDWEHRFGENFPVYQSVSLGGCVLHLSEHHGDCSPGGAVRIECDGVRAFWETLRDKDYRYAKPGVNRQPWGTDEMSITDPFGNRLIFYTPVT
jgi:uncharacterized glyoxalase superfamily protein PhnB